MSAVYSIGETVPLALLLEDGNETQHPCAEIYPAGSSSPLATVALEHKARGRYEGNFVFSDPGVFSIVFITYVDADHAVENIVYSREQEQVIITQHSVDDLALQLLRVLGLVHENAFIDNTVHDDYGQLVSARVRIFDSRAHVEAATPGGSETEGLIATYTITSTYQTQGRMESYRMVKI